MKGMNRYEKTNYKKAILKRRYNRLKRVNHWWSYRSSKHWWQPSDSFNKKYWRKRSNEVVRHHKVERACSPGYYRKFEYPWGHIL